VFGKTRITICREGLYYLVVLSFIVAGAIMREINLLVVIAGMMLAPVFINLRLAIATLSRLTIDRKLPGSIGAGDLLVVEVTVKNTRRWLASWAVVAEDRVERTGGREKHDRQRVEFFFPHVAAGETQTVSYRGRLMTRGRYRFGPLRMSSRFPLGLVRRTVIVDKTDTLLVCPRLGRLKDTWHAESRTEQSGTRTSRSRRGLIEGDFYGLRDYRAGDSRHWIHWRTSARRGSLAVREFERQQEQDLAILLDPWLPDEPTAGQLDNVELAVSFVATAVAEQCRRGGSRLWVGTAGRSASVFDGACSAALMDEVMEHMAELEAHSAPPLSELLARGLQRFGPSGRLVVVSTRRLNPHKDEPFADIRNNPAMAHAAERCLIVDVGSETLGKYFEIE
jgi:uncharacterized protein (DUF58 family)